MAACESTALAFCAVALLFPFPAFSRCFLAFPGRSLDRLRLSLFFARPERAADQSKAVLGDGIHRDHRMQDDPAADSFADCAQTAGVGVARAEIDVARVLNGQNVPPRDGGSGFFAPSGDDAFDRHTRIAKQSAKSDFKLIPAFG
jgi:hypothetical protein